MAISDKLTYLNTTKSLIRDGINAIGGELTSSDTFRSYVNALNNIYDYLPKITGTGTSITLNDTAKGKMILELNATELSQSGTPTPSSPQAVHTISGNNTIKVENSNLAYNGWAEDFVARVNSDSRAKIETYDNRNCLYYSANAGYQEYDTKYLFKRNWKENTQYTISCYIYTPGIDTNMAITYTDGTTATFGTHTANTWEKLTYTSASGKTIKYLRASYNDRWARIDLDTFMINEGTTALDYTPHQEQTTQLNLGDIEYCKIGNYEDKFIRSDDGTWQLEKNIGKVVLDGSESYLTWGLFDTNYFSAYVNKLTSNPAVINGQIISDYFPFSNYGVVANATGEGCFTGGIYIGISIAKNELSDTSTQANAISSLKTWLSNNNSTFYYTLATPTYTQITGTLETQLEYVYQKMLSYTGQTNISQVNNDLPFVINASALKDLSTL